MKFLKKSYFNVSVEIYLGLLLSILCTLFWEVFPAQDLPQHLTYAEIISHYWDNSYPFSQYYYPPESFQAYHSLHYVLSFLSKITGNVEWAFKILMILYFPAALFSLIRLFKALDPENKNISGLYPLAFLSMWNGCLLLGFMAFTFGLPLIWLGIALYLEDIKNDRFSLYRPKQLVLILVMGVVHPFVGLIYLILFTLITLLFTQRKLNQFKTWMSVTFGIVCLWPLLGGVKQGKIINENSFPSLEQTLYGYGMEFIDIFFKVDWSGLSTRVNYFLWQVFGPWRIGYLLLLTASIVAMLVFHYKKKETIKLEKKYFLLAISGIILADVFPWAIYRPSEISFINFRWLTTFIPFLLFALYRPIKSVWPARIHGWQFLIFIAIFGSLFQNEAKIPLRLIKDLPAQKSMGSLIYNGKSSYFAKIYDLTHFMPMYHTLRNKGINTQFWARYTGHLPVAARNEKLIIGAPDWRPWDFKPGHFANADYLILDFHKYPPGNSASKERNFLATTMDVVGCEENWCLYKKR